MPGASPAATSTQPSALKPSAAVATGPKLTWAGSSGAVLNVSLVNTFNRRVRPVGPTGPPLSSTASSAPTAPCTRTVASAVVQLVGTPFSHSW
ncbi:hypothetical protein D3C87_574390 [compost metagenome]